MRPARVGAILKAASAIVSAFGVIVALSAWPITAAPGDLLADLAFWPLDGMPRIDTPAARLLAAIAGGVMFGWGITLWLVTAYVLPKDPHAAETIVRAGIVSWFVLDSLASVAAGAPLNAVLNIGFVVLFLWPLAILARPTESRH